MPQHTPASASVNAARIAIELPASARKDSLTLAQGVAIAAEALAELEAGADFHWEKTSIDWESMCAVLATYISNENSIRFLDIAYWRDVIAAIIEAEGAPFDA